MPSAPYEWLDKVAMSCETLPVLAGDFADREDVDDAEDAFIRFVLGGRFHHTNGGLYLAQVTQPQHAGGLIPADFISASMQGGSFENIPVHEIPHVKLGFADRLTAWLCLPELYYKGCSPQLLLPDIWDIHQAVLAAMATSGVDLNNGLGGGNEDPMEQPATLFDFLSMSSRELRRFASPARVGVYSSGIFPQELRAALDNDVRFRQSFFVYHLSSKATPAGHDPRNSAARRANWNEVRDTLEMLQTEDNFAGWMARISVQFGQDNAALVWQPQAVAQCLDSLLPDVEEAVREELSERRQSKQAAITGVLGDTTLDISSAKALYSYIELRNHFRNQSERRPGWKVITPADTLPGNLRTLLQKTLAAESQCFKLAGEAAGDVSATLAVHVKLYEMQDALKAFPATSELLYLLPRKAWWNFRATRINAVRRVLKRLQLAPPDACLWEEVLAFNAACVSILNSCIISQLESSMMQELLQQMAYFIVPEANNEEEAEWGYNGGHFKSWIEDRGAYFVADTIKNVFENMEGPHIYRIHSRVEVDEDTLVAIYQQKSMSHLRSHFGLGSHWTRLVKLNPSANYRLYKGGCTTLVDATSRRPRASPRDFNNITALNIQIHRPVVQTGPDIRGPGNSYDRVNEVLQGSLIDVLNRLYRQFAHDLMMKSPNKLKGGTYITLRSAELASVTPDYYFHPILPLISARVVLCQPEAWEKNISHLFPSKGNMASSTSNGYPGCTYFRAWTELLNRLDEWDAFQVTAEMRSEVAKFLWLPRTEKGSMWTTRKETQNMTRALPYEDCGSSPYIAANPRYIRGLENLNRFALRR
ncbi:uncharacterized protein PHACADRAFT_33463 [Phanerochaete carnosa HHB-10118-sp]|uniref:Uncharacterized protein n=1 Tax=Phanerochaete carnosa (strain HHB-10118-sp) TaxID=650164 RepID=K5VE52_PHACS|nr:uncharacterized protein PHACADRAFT_33463 [Phanerochaete carnosa HHB-10118-sp]EKM49398.1 hypothetical protein PHACADRAFT_33463 [Phanerochaete carnosa HHB-10118-sp]